MRPAPGEPMRAFNFAAGPSMLPLPVLEQVRAELTDWRGSGMSVLEVSHRSPAFMDLAQELESSLRDLLGIPAHYRVLFLQGGAMAQFSAVPLNLAPSGAHVDYVHTGHWSAKAIAEARRQAQVEVVADEGPSGYTTVPAPGQIRPTPGAAYLHYCPNETIGGVEFPYIPEVGDTPLVADFSSTILSRPLPVARFGLIYAGAQKNLGPAGLTVVIVREDLLGRARPGTPPVLDYTVMAGQGSMVNTPPTFSWYVAWLVLKWIRAGGGLAAMAERNRAKAETLYHAIDASGFYRNPVAPGCRSWMNVPFMLPRPELDAPFLAEAEARGLTNLRGHRSVGGMRASLYNAMPLEGVQALVAFMRDFQRRHG
ncbi:MAG TPA: 3-phosphoserine/phosphohydroxythreonine transaminase [Steroidobacteraceae bacterium]|nr:3-phosphoserine/phosphohydroxythreonine transaminase [Steroidobacteraceae bacterium]